MTPFELDILLHYYCRADDHPSMRNPPPIWAETIRDLYDAQLLTGEGIVTIHKITERGRVLIAHMLSLPLPEWKMP